MKLLITLITILLFPVLSYAEESVSPLKKSIPLPEITFSQKVEIIVPIKKLTGVLSAEIVQDDKEVLLSLMVANITTVDNAKKLGEEFLKKTKNVTLDDPTEKEGNPGKGLYNYTISIIRANAKTVINGEKKAEEETIEWF